MTTINLGKCVSSRLMSFMTLARDEAKKSSLLHRHGAVLFGHSSKAPITTSCNCSGHHVCGYDVPSQHAEAGCLKFLHGRGNVLNGWSQHRQKEPRVLQA